MATMSQKRGTLTDFHLASNLNNLPHNEAKPLGGASAGTPYIDNSSLGYPNSALHFTFNLNTSGLIMGGTVEVYLMSCLDTPGTTTNWSEGINPADTNDISGSIYTLTPIIVLPANNNMNAVDVYYVVDDISLVSYMNNLDAPEWVGDLPPYWTLIVWNKSGNSLVSSGHAVKYQLKSYQV